MAKISTKTQLKEYILRQLGSPVICVEIDPSQLDDRIDDAVERFFDRHVDGVDERVIFLQTERGKQDYTLNDTVVSVYNVIDMTNYLNEEPLLRQEPFVTSNWNHLNGNVDIPQFEVWMQSFKMVENYFDNSPLYDFNATTKRFHIFDSDLDPQKLALQVYVSEQFAENIYNNRWLKQYATALSGLQWATNISKYGGAPLPGGAELNYQDIEQRYENMRERLEEQLEQEYSEPIEFFWG